MGWANVLVLMIKIYFKGMKKMEENLVDALHESGMFYLYLGILISSDSVFSKEDALSSINSLKSLEKELDSSSLSSKVKSKYKKEIKKCYEVLNSDIKRFDEN